MSSKTITRIVALLVAAAALAAFGLYQAGFFTTGKINLETTPEASPAADASEITPVNGMVLQSRQLNDYITVSGSTMPAEEVLVSTEVPGKVKAILFREGDFVKKGVPLIRLDDDELQAERNRLEVSAELNEKIAGRLKGLYEKEGVSLQEYEVAEAEYRKALAELALVDAQLEKRIVRAPFSGRLGLRLISEGSYLAPGMPIVNLVSSNPIKIEFSVPEKYSRYMGKGTKVQFSVDGVAQKQEAIVEASDPVIDAETRTFRLKATAANPKGLILPGAFASIRVNLQAFDASLMVPTEAVVPELGGKKVFVYQNGQAVAVPVQTGIRQEASIQIVDGLEPGDTVITTGVLQIRSGTAVEINKLD